MASHLNQIVERIAAIQVAEINVPGQPIPYILQAEPYQPSNIDSLSLPFFVNIPRGGRSNLPITSGQQYRDINVYMMLVVQRRQANVDLRYNLQTTEQWVDAVFSVFANHIKLSAPSIPILQSTNTTPIVVSTGFPLDPTRGGIKHGYNTGDPVTVSGVAVNTNANGAWIVTVIDEWTFSLNGSVGNGAGLQTGVCRLTQPGDLNGFITDAVITSWDVVPFTYGTAMQEPNFTALQFVLSLQEFYVQTLNI